MELREKIARLLFTLETQGDALRFEDDFVKKLYFGKAKLFLDLIKEAGYVKLADMDYRYLPVKETYCYDNGWRKLEI